ncbi:outer membrane protein assembly factor BamC [Motilimonas sp. KMU-193]|uniref:outer membrane protein assembly factor BamC n=1 Tax=Motilimonas sp. KMU-193 TaxID=3388668 RepID=UPI00396B1D8D
MLNRQKILVGGVLLAILAGCSSPESRKQAVNDFDYLDASLATPLSTEGVGELEQDPTYKIPALGTNASGEYLGKKVDVRSPSQVLPVLQGTYVDESSDKVTVTFTEAIRGGTMKDDVWTLMLNFLAQQNVATVSLDKGRGELVSDYFTFEETFGSFWNKTRFRSKEQYKFYLKESSSSRSASLAVELLDVTESIDGDVNKGPLTVAEKNRYETNMINRLLVFALAEHQRLVGASQSVDNRVPIELGFDANGLPAWVTTVSYDKVWQKLPLALGALNFEEEASNKTLGFYRMSFKQPSESFWKEQGVRRFDLDRGDYIFQLGQSQDGQTLVTIFDKDKKPLSVQQVSSMYLSIADLMQKQMQVEAK